MKYTIKDLKELAYDTLVNIEALQKQLKDINTEIYKLSEQERKDKEKSKDVEETIIEEVEETPKGNVTKIKKTK